MSTKLALYEQRSLSAFNNSLEYLHINQPVSCRRSAISQFFRVIDRSAVPSDVRIDAKFRVIMNYSGT